MSEEKETLSPAKNEYRSPETSVEDSDKIEKPKHDVAESPKYNFKNVLKKVSIIAMLAVAVIFFVQNAVLVNIRFLGWDSRVFLSVAILFGFSIGLLIGWLIWKVFRQ